MDLFNLTPFAARDLVLPNGTGDEVLAIIAKTTHDVRDGWPRVSEKQEPIRLVDEYYGEPDKSSIKWASDVGIGKPATDITLVGGAYSTPTNRYHVDVRLRVGRLEKWVRVVGNRQWETSMGVAGLGPPEPFDRMPLVWERAFGGTDKSVPDHLEGEPINPVGIGFRAAKSQLPIQGSWVPNIENPWQLMRAPADRPPPAGFSFVAPGWQPRIAYAGTYDATWQQNRAPFLPSDFNPLYYQTSPADQIYPGDVEMGAPVEVINASPSGSLAFCLPPLTLEAVVKAGDDRVALTMRRDTIVIDGDTERLLMVWRATVPVNGRIYEIDWIKVHAPGGWE
jgi:hypothetical protein